MLGFLVKSGIWQRLPVDDMKAILQHGENLSACIGLRRYQNQNIARAQKGQASAENLFLQAMYQCTKERHEPEYNFQEEFYSDVTRVDKILDHLLDIEDPSNKIGAALQSVQERAERSDALAKRIQRTWEVNAIFKCFIDSIWDYRDTHGELYPEGIRWTDWTTSDRMRNLMTAQHRQIIHCLSDQGSTTQSSMLMTDILDQLYTISNFLLESFVDAIKEHEAKVARQQQQQPHSIAAYSSNAVALANLKEQFEATRFEVIQCFVAKQAYHYAYTLAEKYHDFRALVELSEFLNDEARLKKYMDMFRSQGFLASLFQYYLENGLYSRILNVDPKYWPEVTEFVKGHPGLEWMHAVQTGQVKHAADKLVEISSNVEMVQTLAEKKTKLSLAKLACLAAPAQQQPEVEPKLEDVNDMLHFIRAQEFLDKIGLDQFRTVPLDPEHLIAVCCDLSRGKNVAEHIKTRILVALEVYTHYVHFKKQDIPLLLRQIWLSAWLADMDKWIFILEDPTDDVAIMDAIRESTFSQCAAKYAAMFGADAAGMLTERVYNDLVNSDEFNTAFIQKRKKGTSSTSSADENLQRLVTTVFHEVVAKQQQQQQ
eukprot:GEZU01013910.1.p1 GENE.GEZU01013910.1~~GEZU01013910.1.p1  ORF type:complete len:668 (+),score=170.00 GEZU01013910.1:211-2004(+)